MRTLNYRLLQYILWVMAIPLLIFVFMIDTFYVIDVLFDYYSKWVWLLLPVVVFTTLSLIPFIQTLMFSHKLLILIEKNENHEQYPILLEKIRKSTLYFAISLTVTLPFVYLFVDADDSPGLLLMFLIITFSGYICSSCAYVLKDFITKNKTK